MRKQSAAVIDPVRCGEDLQRASATIDEALQRFRTTWSFEEMCSVEEVLSSAKAMLHEKRKDLENPLFGTEWDGIHADVDNAWTLIDLGIDAMRGDWIHEEMAKAGAMLLGSKAMIDSARRSIADLAIPAAVGDGPYQVQAEDDQAEAPFADAAVQREEADRLARASMFEHMQQAAPNVRTLSTQDMQFHRLWCDLNNASSLLTAATCTGWTREELERCTAMVSGAQALIDRGRAFLEETEAAYLGARAAVVAADDPFVRLAAYLGARAAGAAVHQVTDHGASRGEGGEA